MLLPACLPCCRVQGVTEVTLQARSPDGDVSVAVPLTATPQGEGYEALLQALASKAVLKELEEQDEEEGGKTAEVKDQVRGTGKQDRQARRGARQAGRQAGRQALA